MHRNIYDLGERIKFVKVGGKVKGILRLGQNVSVFECEMSVAYAFFKVLIEREYHKRTSYLLPRSRNDQLIRGSPTWERNYMKKMGSDKKEAAPVAPPRSAGKEEGNCELANVNIELNDNDAQHQHQSKIQVPDLKKLKGNCKTYCAVITYAILGVIAILVSAAVIIVTSLAAVATKIYDAEQSSRLVAMVVLAVTAAITLSMVIYAIVGAFKRNVKSLHATGIVLIILAIIQALIVGVAINVTARDELAIGKSLGESFQMAKDDNPRHVKLWSATQHDLQCCGVYGPEDYRDPKMPYYFPPNIPISCCLSYDTAKAPYNQERQRDLCKVNGTYYENGCKGLVVEVFKETSVVVIGVIVVLIVLEVLLTILGAYLKKHDHRLRDKDEEQEHKGSADK